MNTTEQKKLVLHNYFRSSSAYRVRIAMNLKGLDYDYVSVHLTRSGGEQFLDAFKNKLNPHALVPVLDTGDASLTQSLSIIEYLEEVYPAHPLLPGSALDRAYVRQLSLAIACEMHPLNNLRVLKYLSGPLGLSEDAKSQWIHNWLQLGLEALEAEVAASPKRGQFCFGDTPTLADCCLVPQLFNARRFNVDLTPYPVLLEIDARCNQLDAFQRAHPGKQIDSE
ncbi:MAG: maleylacetoacetate isomerase [Pseudomonadota bacterium]